MECATQIERTMYMIGIMYGTSQMAIIIHEIKINLKQMEADIEPTAFSIRLVPFQMLR